MTDYMIWKTVLFPVRIMEITVPEGAEMLCAREQHNEMCVWFRCDPAAPPTKRTIFVIGTGHLAPENAHYIGTCFMEGGDLVWHIFEQGA